MLSTSLALDMAQTSLIASTAVVIALGAIVAFTVLGVYRARHSAARETEYRTLAERTTDAAAKHAESAQATVAALQGVREDLSATRAELAEVRKRLAGLEQLLSQIG